jgi:hypothetical protein
VGYSVPKGTNLFARSVAEIGGVRVLDSVEITRAWEDSASFAPIYDPQRDFFGNSGFGDDVPGLEDL